MTKLDSKTKSTLNRVAGKVTNKVKKVQKAINTIDEKAERIKKYRAEASKKASKANKRIKRLEANDLTDSPAYKNYIAEQGKFSVKGKTYNELQREVARLDKFIEAQTSTITGINKNLKEIASNTGIKYSNLKELRAKSSKFFELSSKVEQYLRTVEDMASAIGYQKIWEQINVYVQQQKVDLAAGEADIDSMVEAVSKALANYEKPTKVPQVGWYALKDTPENK